MKIRTSCNACVASSSAIWCPCIRVCLGTDGCQGFTRGFYAWDACSMGHWQGGMDVHPDHDLLLLAASINGAPFDDVSESPTVMTRLRCGVCVGGASRGAVWATVCPSIAPLSHRLVR